MRDINRIDKFCDELKEQWKKVPDWRFAQLISNLQGYKGSDMFYYEDNDFMNELKKFLGGTND